MNRKNILTAAALIFISGQSALAGDDLAIGKSMYAKKDYNKAAEAFERVLKKDRSNSLAHYYMGNCYVAKHDWSEAKAEYQSAANSTRDEKIRDYCMSVIASIEAGHPSASSYAQSGGNGSPDTSYDDSINRGKNVMNQSQATANQIMRDAERQCTSIAQDRDNALFPTNGVATRSGMLPAASAEDKEQIAHPYNQRIEEIRNQARAKVEAVMRSGQDAARRAVSP